MEMMTSIAAMAPLDLVALAAIVLIGLPHGALDGAIAIHLGFTRKLLHFMRFLALYIAMAGLVVGAWHRLASQRRGHCAWRACHCRNQPDAPAGS